MLYCTIDDIKERIPEKTIQQLTDDDRTGVVDQDKVDAAIERACKEIDAYCGARYKVPFTTVPAVVSELTADLAVYYLYSRKVEKIPETRIDAKKHAIDLLKDISKGNVSLGVDPAPSARSKVSAAFSGNERQMTRDKLQGM